MADSQQKPEPEPELQSQSQSQPAPDAEAETTPASPPLPKPHTAVTPGPRAARLEELYAQCLKRTLNKLAWENIAGCYPTVASRQEKKLRQVQESMVGKLETKCKKEFESIMVVRQVVPKMNELESLMSDASRRREEALPTDAAPTPPHLLPASAILTAHLTPALTAHQSQLNARLQTTQSQNALLHDEVRRQREEIESLLERLEGVVGDVRGANEALGEVMEDVVREGRGG